MNKKKLIAELAKELEACCNENRCDGEPTCAKCRSRWIVEQGYRKLPKGSVVLTKTQYKVLKKDAKQWTDACKSIWKQVSFCTRKETARDILLSIGKAKDNNERYVIWCKLCARYGVEVDDD